MSISPRTGRSMNMGGHHGPVDHHGVEPHRRPPSMLADLTESVARGDVRRVRQPDGRVVLVRADGPRKRLLGQDAARARDAMLAALAACPDTPLVNGHERALARAVEQIELAGGWDEHVRRGVEDVSGGDVA